MNRNPSRSSGLDELNELTKPKFTLKPQKRGISSKVADQSDAINRLTDMVNQLSAKLEAVEEEVQLADNDELQIAPLAKFITSEVCSDYTHVYGTDDGAVIEFTTTPVFLGRVTDVHHEQIVFRLVTGKKVTGIIIELPADPENVFEESFRIDPQAPFIAVALTILNLISSKPVLIPRSISRKAQPYKPTSHRLLGAPSRGKTLALPPPKHPDSSHSFSDDDADPDFI